MTVSPRPRLGFPVSRNMANTASPNLLTIIEPEAEALSLNSVALNAEQTHKVSMRSFNVRPRRHLAPSTRLALLS